MAVLLRNAENTAILTLDYSCGKELAPVLNSEAGDNDPPLASATIVARQKDRET
jgi:hypothetical protein